MTKPAWALPPDRYLEMRPAEYAVPKIPTSSYVTMRDGCRLAVDVYLPDGDAAQSTYPALLFFTPYYRRFRLTEGSTADPNPNTGKFRDFFVARGYAVVVIDVRGTGASFGVRDGFRSPAERLDSAEIADWVTEQAWSNGIIGATGISYLGAAADFLASTGHPAVKAIAPISSVWDTYSDNYFPGGLQIRSLTGHYDTLMLGLDQDRRDILKQFSYFSNPDFIGPQTVDEDKNGTLVSHALKDHAHNYRQTEFMADQRFREDGLPYDADYDSAAFSPYKYVEGVSPDVAILSISGWMDGAGYANGSIARFLTLRDNPHHLLLGPWDHGARIDVSPWRSSVEPTFPLLAEILRFFDTYLMRRDSGLVAEAPVHYYCLHEECWRAAESWPPSDDIQTFYPEPGGGLGRSPSTGNSHYSVAPLIGTGTQTRYERIAGIDSRDYYADWLGRTDRMLSWDSPPLDAPLDIVGHAVLTLDLSLDTPDAAIFVYLSEIEHDGTERYITEGVLRALHRAEESPPSSICTSWPWHPFRRDTARPWQPGHFEKLRIPLLPTAWQLQPGSQLRVSLAGADADHFGKIPHGRAPVFNIRLENTHLALPIDHARLT